MIRMPAAVMEQLKSESAQAYPNECCGILLGAFRDGSREVRHAIPCENARTDSPRNRYSIDPKELVHIQREAREQGLEIIGFYHSHPDHPPAWSHTDLAEAHWIGCSYVITGVDRAARGVTRSFVLLGSDEDDKRFESEPIELTS